jgi:tRNA (cytidine/uridine-2'-O-)-methyltransferase
MINIVLVYPKIPSNTGNIGRLAVGSDATLHLIKPLGFNIDDKSVKRAGLDYWADVDLKIWDTLDEFWLNNPKNDRHFFATTKTDKKYYDVKFQVGDFIYFGAEDAGLPIELIKSNFANAITIPMNTKIRSINLSNSVGIILYEVIRQNS